MMHSQTERDGDPGRIDSSLSASPHRSAVALVGHPSFLTILLILAFALFFGLLAVQQHRAFQTHGLDLGNVDQALWNTAQGRFLHFTLMAPVQSRLALHVEPILLFFVPLYWLGLGGPELLLVVQAGVVALGAWPVYRLARHNLPLTKPGEQGAHHYLLLVFPLAYLLLPTLESAVLFDFHAVTLTPTFLLFAFWSLERNRDLPFFLFALLAMAGKEDMPLVVAMLGLYAGLARQRWRLAGVTLALSVVWFTIAFFVIQPRFAAGGNIQLDRYAWLGDSPPEMVGTIVTRPGLVFNHLWDRADLPGYLANLFLPTAYLALLSPLTLLPMLPTLAINLLSDNPFTWRLEDFHYGAPLAPFLMISAIYGIKHLTRWVTPGLGLMAAGLDRATGSSVRLLTAGLILLLLVFSLATHFQRGYTPLSRAFAWPEVTPHHQRLAALLDTIPADSALFTQSNLAPHLSQRRTVYGDFGYFTDPDFPAAEPVEDILLDVTGFENIGGLHEFLRRSLLEQGDTTIVIARDGLLHLRQANAGGEIARQVASLEEPAVSKAPSIDLPPEFYTFARPDSPPDYRLTVDFGDRVRLTGYSLHFNRQEEIQVSLDLEPLQPLSDIHPVLYLLDDRGQPLGATVDRQPGLVWYPPERWPVDQTVRVRFNTLPWHTREIEAYRLAVGLIGGDDGWDLNRRHRPAVVESTRLAPRLPAGESLLELARIEQIWQMPHGGPVERRFGRPIIAHPAEANFDDQIKFLGYSTPAVQAPAVPGGRRSISFDLYWQAVAVPPRLIRFVQLVGPDGQLYGQSDANPDNGHYPTQLWQPGEVVVETIRLPLPAERPTGRYSLPLGLYRPDTGQRLRLRSGEDHIELTHPLFDAR